VGGGHQPRGNQVITIYVHLNPQDIAGVKKGAKVVQGQLIGLMGMTGRATGYHLHFGVKGQRRVDGPHQVPADFQPAAALARHSALCGKNRAADNHPATGAL